MGSIKIVSWNICDLGRLTEEPLNQTQQKRKESIIREIKDLTPDILCILEGPKGDNIDLVSNDWLNGEWIPVKASDGEYATQGEQWIWFLVRNKYSDIVSLLPIETWDAFAGGSSWKYHLWGEFEEKTHKHYRHPQVLILNWEGLRVELIGLHLKSKFINKGEKMWKAGGQKRQDFIREALTARIKMTTEATNVRRYIDAKFNQVANPAIFVMGDLNDGPGKEYFEENYLFFDLISNIQGDVFFARRYLYHALFDFANDLRWSVYFEDFVEEPGRPKRDPHILLDHLLFTQGLVDGSLPLRIDAHAGKVEHEIHDLINGPLQKSARTSDHKPVSLIVTTKD